jgi:hypothetical protein
MGSRKLNGAEQKVLVGLTAKVKEIVDAGDEQALRATGVLDAGLGAAPQDYLEFSRRFDRLHASLVQLTRDDKVQVDDDLPSTMGANTPTGHDASGNVLVSIDLAAHLVSPSATKSITARAITLIHELSHSLYEAAIFPVKDYTYRVTWAQGYLGGEIGARNADTYAEAAAQIAERIEGVPPVYREVGVLPAQRRALQYQARDGLSLGPALAWADIVLNRAWLRSEDYQVHAQVTCGSGPWAKVLAAWRVDPDKSNLMAIEDVLVDRKIIEARWGPLTVGLSEKYFRTTKNISTYLAGLKDTLARLRPAFAGDVQAVEYDPATKVLKVPFDLAGTPVTVLADHIVAAMVAKRDFSDAADVSTAVLNRNRHMLADLMFTYDRPFEGPQVQALLAAFHALPTQTPTLAGWGLLPIILDLAEVQGQAEIWTRTAYRVGLPDMVVTDLKNLDANLGEDVDRLLVLGKRLSSHAFTREHRERAAAFTTLADCLTRISQRVTQDYPAKAPRYQQLVLLLTPFTKP